MRSASAHVRLDSSRPSPPSPAVLLQVSTACPQGQFSAPAYCDANAYSIHAGPGAPQDQQQPGSSLLEQLQVCNNRHCFAAVPSTTLFLTHVAL